ncbi:hypothetical protein [Burkholderia sp. IDO3]|uniref:hypothetical protein n=1 Tax=Burkholderia sp. IDO3 TaxID=1705310 RepID=UPI000BBAA37A|nr:hypothetical protein [Burkholderia sp. IDO3]AXK63143.1 hypothetical protein DCN14_11150 [Burkholderia sp. IDO3]PCD62187.1 hypothetical protein CN645_07975 [Burkholderia sp. IDO3]
MTSVTIELGSGKRATLLIRAGSAPLSADQRSAVSELMLHWPKYAGLTTNALTYLRQLGQNTLRGPPLDVLRSAIEDGRVTVKIERPAAGGGTAGGQPSARPFPLANRLPNVPPVASLPIDKPLPFWATPSDVSASELMSYLESVVGTGGATEMVGGASTLLGDAQPFELPEDASLKDRVQLAVRSAAGEEECFAQYERELEECKAYGAMTKDPYTFVACKAQAFMNYNQCRGF